MSSVPEISIGRRIRFYRLESGKGQAVVAGLAGITEDYLSRIENDKKTPTIVTLHKLASALNVSVSLLLGEPMHNEDGPIHPVGAEIEAALLTRASVPADVPSLASLRVRVDMAWSAWQSAPHRYTAVSAVLPSLVVDVQRAARALRHDPDQSRDASRLLADLYFLVRTFAKRIGRTDLSLVAADRGVTAAEDADDPLRIAAARWNLGHILLSQGSPESAEQTAVGAARELVPRLEDASPDTAALYGALWLVAALAKVRQRDSWGARDILREYARPASLVSGEGNVLWTVFGPMNVEIHAMSVDMESGEAAQALTIANGIDIASSLSLERRTTFYLEVARCYEQRHNESAVLAHLTSAESTGPEDLRYNLLARDLVRGLVDRAPATLRPQALGLAKRIGIRDV